MRLVRLSAESAVIEPSALTETEEGMSGPNSDIISRLTGERAVLSIGLNGICLPDVMEEMHGGRSQCEGMFRRKNSLW